jgi:hypothetical protein
LVSVKQGSVNLPGSRANTSNRSPRDRRTRASRNATKRDYRLTLDDNDKQRLDLPHAIIHWWLMRGDCTPKSKLLLSQASAWLSADSGWIMGNPVRNPVRGAGATGLEPAASAESPRGRGRVGFKRSRWPPTIGQSGEMHPPRKSSREEPSWQALPFRCQSQTNPITNYFRTCVCRRSQSLYLRQTSRPRLWQTRA